MSRRIVIANWKMNQTLAEAGRFVERLAPSVRDVATDVGIAPPFVYLPRVVELARAVGIRVFGQTCHQQANGAHTGEVSVAMLRDVGADGVLVGHSERRRDHGETDDVVAAKLEASLGGGLAAVLCVGETLAERDDGVTDAVIGRQIERALRAVEPSDDGPELVVAYEPVWAIGTGRVATAEQIRGAMATVRRALEVAGWPATTRVIYGGSVSAGNASALFEDASVDGALVGGASLDPASFAAIAAAAT